MAIQFLLSRLFSLRLLLVILAVTLVLLPGGLPGFSLPDRLLFELTHPAAAQAIAMPTTAMSDAAFAALVQDQGFAIPAWSPLAGQVGVLLCLLFLVWLLPQLGTTMATLATFTLLTALVVSQLVVMLYQSLWLPLGQVMTFLAAGFITMLFWFQPRRMIRRLETTVRERSLQLGRMLLDQGDADGALAVVDGCPVDDDSLTLRYDAGIHQERRRQYDQARQTFQAIQHDRKRYRDVAERLEAIARLTGEAAGATDFEATRTLVMPELAVSRPTLGRYEIQRELGRGAMGVVYLGKDPKIARTVAIKTLSYSQYDPGELPELKARFFREAEAAGRLNHPAIVTVFDVGEEADLAFIAMDFAAGKPLSTYSRSDSLLPLPVVLTLMAQAAEALDYAHSQKIVHRDIKPANLIYDAAGGQLKVTDFGIAKITDDAHTRTGSVMGSPLYMSPEQLKGQKVTGASDIYSLGVTLYKLVSGETPYAGDTLANLTYQILNKRPRSVKTFNPDLPPAVVRLINKAIQSDPAKRFASAGEMAQALNRAASRETSKGVAG
ncbi:serine/threonine-protein kinase [Marinobacter zhejiangensis]|uniref:non-specific serine/threonine protein kinase n=1 Tax=Marinobacter zhejiangensis TaxID=488535 RepID=A0A1I4LK41_9GAMM|nr:serine/threonine-protein kinase [Marinobacter zhejiangensis]SFL91478.1 serine/threonine protein kinase [Marinobacter zhejiangensis]